MQKNNKIKIDSVILKLKNQIKIIKNIFLKNWDKTPKLIKKILIAILENKIKAGFTSLMIYILSFWFSDLK